MADKKKLPSSFFNMVLVLTLIALASALALGFTYSGTKDAIAQVEVNRTLAALKQVLPEFDNNPNDEKYTLDDEDYAEMEFFPAKKEGQPVGIAVRTYSDNGFTERIWLMVGFTPDLKINSISVLKHKETPGLGTKMKEPKFHLVAKPCPDKQRALTDSHLFWRISFSEAEKTLLKSASSDKKYYRITKAIHLAKKSSLKPLTSFHLKNLFLHYRSEHPRAKHDDSNLGESVVCFFQSLIDCLERGSLRHFFVNRRSLLAEMSEAERMGVVDKLTRYRNKLVQNPKAFLERLHFFKL